MGTPARKTRGSSRGVAAFGGGRGGGGKSEGGGGMGKPEGSLCEVSVKIGTGGKVLVPPLPARTTGERLRGEGGGGRGKPALPVGASSSATVPRAGTGAVTLSVGVNLDMATQNRKLDKGSQNQRCDGRWRALSTSHNLIRNK